MRTMHEDDVELRRLAGRTFKMLVGPQEPLRNNDLCCGVSFFPPKSKHVGHIHEKEVEIIYIISGEGEMVFNDRPESLKPGTCIQVPTGVHHRVTVTSEEEMKMFWVVIPPVVVGSYDHKDIEEKLKSMK